MDRRRFVTRAGGLAIASSIHTTAMAKPAKDDIVMPSKTCKPVILQTPGPYVTPDYPLRSDIRDGLPGAVLELDIRVLDSLNCSPAAGQIVDIWSCDAAGRYAGFVNIDFDINTLQPAGAGLDLTGETFMRGRQVTDENGLAKFTTIIPGWYVPRLPHIHIRAMAPGLDWTATTTQLYFPPDLEAAVYEMAPYAARGPNPIRPKRDLVLRGDKATQKALTLNMAKDGDSYRSTFDLRMA